MKLAQATEAFVWSTAQVRASVIVPAGDYEVRNERPGSDKEMIADVGEFVGLILRTYWGNTPLGHGLTEVSEQGVEHGL